MTIPGPFKQCDMSDSPFRGPDAWRRAWDSVSIVRPVHYSLFTFGETELLYWLVQDADREKTPVRIARGEVKVTRPLIITPDNARPEFQNFFEDEELAGMADFLMARSAAFSHLRFDKRQGPQQIVSDSVEEAVCEAQQAAGRRRRGPGRDSDGSQWTREPGRPEVCSRPDCPQRGG